MKILGNKSKNKKGKSHRFFGVSPKIQRSSNLLFPLLARGLEGIKCILNICACFWRLPRLRLAMTPYHHSERSEESSKINIKTWILRFAFAPLRMTMLALVLSLGVAGESWAACVGATTTTAGTDENGNYCGICNAAGTCKWKLDSFGELNIYTDEKNAVTMDNYGFTNTHQGSWEKGTSVYPNFCQTTAPWGGLGATSLVIGDNITNIGQSAFMGESKITKVSGMNDVTIIKQWAFDWATKVTDFAFPSSLTTIEMGAFGYIQTLTNLTLPDTVTSVGSLFGYDWPMEINCVNTVGKCDELETLLRRTNNMTGKSFIVGPIENCSFYNGVNCIECRKNYLLSEGQCWAPWNRKRYTPAEAAQWLNEDNNTITLTFKKR